MRSSPDAAATLREWQSIPRRIRGAISGLSTRQLSARGGSEGWAIREYVHHLVEANLVASTIVLAAVGRPGCRYDWSWLVPDRPWMRRLRYDRAPVGPALRLLESLGPHVARIARGRGMRASVRLAGDAGRARRRTVVELLADECDHVRHHLRDLRQLRRRALGGEEET